MCGETLKTLAERELSKRGVEALPPCFGARPAWNGLSRDSNAAKLSPCRVGAAQTHLPEFWRVRLVAYTRLLIC